MGSMCGLLPWRRWRRLGALGGFELLHELDGVVAEGGEGLDVFGDVDGHPLLPVTSYFYKTRRQ